MKTADDGRYNTAPTAPLRAVGRAAANVRSNREAHGPIPEVVQPLTPASAARGVAPTAETGDPGSRRGRRSQRRADVGIDLRYGGDQPVLDVSRAEPAWIPLQSTPHRRRTFPAHGAGHRGVPLRGSRPAEHLHPGRRHGRAAGSRIRRLHDAGNRSHRLGDPTSPDAREPAARASQRLASRGEPSRTASILGCSARRRGKSRRRRR